MVQHSRYTENVQIEVTKIRSKVRTGVFAVKVADGLSSSFESRCCSESDHKFQQREVKVVYFKEVGGVQCKSNWD